MHPKRVFIVVKPSRTILNVYATRSKHILNFQRGNKNTPIPMILVAGKNRVFFTRKTHDRTRSTTVYQARRRGP